MIAVYFRYRFSVSCIDLMFYLSVSGQAVKTVQRDPNDVDLMKAVGDRVSFRPDNFVPPVTSIIWKHINTSGTVNQAIEWDEGEILIPNQRFRDITNVDEKTGQITITNLKVEHSGVYTIDINSKEQQQRFNLTVMERVPKPVIYIEPSVSPGVVYLRCEYSETIIWKNSTGETLTGSLLYPKGESITVINEGNPENFYTCTLDNGASEETSDPVYERDLFKESNTRFIVAIVIPAITVIIILFLIMIVFHGDCAASCGRHKIYKKITAVSV
ncbi:uncharacterized protein LOC125272909 isoform X2 [Megalobrama amblycephala]|uniref:uncharacterized protein LOC125272909 isoform X2 n=1 Tax=Megalobrama amblycephala TaxID=75352 RepID=UPI0020145CFD|nr:uncharacterized protein LOC125272909 isoform X2 [Megalobrama amblycephala]